jgi:hypothetical protein
MRKLIIPALAVAVSVFSAFVTKPTASMFAFGGASTNAAHRVDPTKYTLVTSPPAGCSGEEVELCSIWAEADGSNKPIITGALLTDLDNSGRTSPVFTSADVQGKP